jgi:predicted protein tyrosine phosphatase
VRVAVAALSYADRAIAMAAPDLIVTAYYGEPVRSFRGALHLSIADIVPPVSSTDGSGSVTRSLMESLSQTLDRMGDRDGCVLFMCLAGLSRSPALALFAAERERGAGLAAWAAMKQSIPLVAPNPDILAVGADCLGGSAALRSIQDETITRPRSQTVISDSIFMFRC